MSNRDLAKEVRKALVKAVQVIQDAQGVPVEIGRLKPGPVTIAKSAERPVRRGREAKCEGLNLRLETGLRNVSD